MFCTESHRATMASAPCKLARSEEQSATRLPGIINQRIRDIFWSGGKIIGGSERMFDLKLTRGSEIPHAELQNARNFRLLPLEVVAPPWLVLPANLHVHVLKNKARQDCQA